VIKSYSEILLVITAGPSVLYNWKGVSAAAWETSLPGADEHGLGRGFWGVEVTPHANSNETEAALLALCEALNRVPEGERAEVLVSQTWICEGINGGVDRWADENWKDRPNSELWKQYLAIRDEMKVQAEAKHIPAADPYVADRISFLRKQARKLRDVQSRKLGTPTGGFGPIE